jgi:hypothetical protein
LELTYAYSIDEDIVDIVDFIHLYVFDDQDQFVELLSVDASALIDGYKIAVPDYYKNKTLVVWAHELDSNYHLPVLQVGDAMSLLTLQLATTDNISSKKLANLLYGGKEIMTFGDGNELHTIDFIRTDNSINVTLKDSKEENLSLEGSYAIELTACNAHYSTDHNIIANSPKMTYLPTNYVSSRSRSGKAKTANLHTLRLQTAYNNDVKLKIYNTKQAQYITFDGSEELLLIDYLLKTKPADISAQSYLDNKSTWDLSFAVSDEDPNMALNITINGWTIWFNSTEL